MRTEADEGGTKGESPEVLPQDYRAPATRNCTRCDDPVSDAWMCARCSADEIAERDGDDYTEPEFECAGFNDGTGFYCPLWGSEECDWECPKGGME